MMKFSLFLRVGLCLVLTGGAWLGIVPARAQSDRAEVTLKTSAGTIVIALYNETPIHRDNFLKHVEEKVYDGTLFHRVIQNFVVQGGDPNSFGAMPDTHLGDGDAGEPLEAEFRFPQLYHKRGAVAAARQGDDVNPEKKSSGSQFYIVWGKTYSNEQLDVAQHRLDSVSGGSVKLTPKIRDYYKMFGGIPHLDGSYTVFGEVIKGLEVVYRIQQAETNDEDRPLYDVVIKKARVTKRLKP